MKNLLKAMLVTVVVLVVPANAAIVSYTDSITGLFDQVADRDLVVSQFDSSLGTLNSVTITVSTSLQAVLGAESTNTTSPASGTKAFYVSTYFTASGTTYNTGASVTLSFDGTDISTAAYTDATQYTVYLTKYDGTTDYAGTSGTTVATFSAAGSNVLFYDSVLSSFIGNGTLTFALDSSGHTTLVTGGGNMSTCMSTTGQAYVTVTYDYTPVPEPTTMALLALGGLFCARRKK